MAGSIYYQHAKGTECRDKRHRSCAGTWRGEIREEGYRRRVNGQTKREVQDRLEEIERERPSAPNGCGSSLTCGSSASSSLRAKRLPPE
ncbi:MAG TPA: hypothetical protein VMA72_21580 [Streptosporangiaceae bacterium]|nr:hypothetical protein [Streptosporangiaceae bacterium]